MPKMTCRCDYTMDLSPIPAPDMHVLISDRHVFDFARDLGEGKRVGSEALYDNLINRGTDAYLCPNCARLWLDYDPGTPMRCYAPEE